MPSYNETYPHPATTILRERRITQCYVAHALGMSKQHVNAVLTGGDFRGSKRFRRGLAELLGMDECDLFADEGSLWRWRVRRVLRAAPPECAEEAARAESELGAP